MCWARRGSQTARVTKKPEQPQSPWLTDLVASYCRRNDIFRPGSGVLLAVSGGADSLCLLHVMHYLASALKIELHVAHVNHRLRDHSAIDAEFVAAEARRLDLPFSLTTVDVCAERHSGDGGQEAVARDLRYAALRSIAAGVGAECIVTGHNQDDQAERCSCTCCAVPVSTASRACGREVLTLPGHCCRHPVPLSKASTPLVG